MRQCKTTFLAKNLQGFGKYCNFVTTIVTSLKLFAI